MGKDYTTAIRYYTRSGNTKKLADAVAEELKAEALDVRVPLEEKVDILFLGCSYYAFDIDEAVKTFLETNKDQIGRVVCFGTSAMMKSMKKPVIKAVKDITVADAEFHCRGQFGKLHRNRPNEQDLADIRKFARSVVRAAK